MPAVACVDEPSSVHEADLGAIVHLIFKGFEQIYASSGHEVLETKQTTHLLPFHRPRGYFQHPTKGMTVEHLIILNQRTISAPY
jgi:hypothetical protein